MLFQYNSRVLPLDPDADLKKLHDNLHAEYMEKEGRRASPLEELVVLRNISICTDLIYG